MCMGTGLAQTHGRAGAGSAGSFQGNERVSVGGGPCKLEASGAALAWAPSASRLRLSWLAPSPASIKLAGPLLAILSLANLPPPLGVGNDVSKVLLRRNGGVAWAGDVAGPR